MHAIAVAVVVALNPLPPEAALFLAVFVVFSLAVGWYEVRVYARWRQQKDLRIHVLRSALVEYAANCHACHGSAKHYRRGESLQCPFCATARRALKA